MPPAHQSSAVLADGWVVVVVEPAHDTIGAGLIPGLAIVVGANLDMTGWAQVEDTTACVVLADALAFEWRAASITG